MVTPVTESVDRRFRAKSDLFFFADALHSADVVGTFLNQRYQLLHLLGQGGMGAVYAAEDTSTGQQVAVKLIERRLLEAGADNVRRFRRESRAASAIKSEHIVRILDSGSDENQEQPYIVMELLAGEDLQQIIDRVGPLSPETTLRIGVQALRGLAAAHEARIIHRDIKPSNLFLAQQPDGTRIVKLLDFGIAKMQSDPAKAMHSAGMTGTGDLLGSPLYMSPEQVMSTKDVDSRSDLWSLGSVLYCALTGFAPHVESSAAVGRLLVTICSKPVPPLGERAPWVPEAITRAIAPALEREPSQRYTAATDMLDALSKLLPDGATLHDDRIVAANTGEHVIVRPAIAGLSAPGGDEPTMPADDNRAMAATEAAPKSMTLAEPLATSKGKPWYVLLAAALLVVMTIVFFQWITKENAQGVSFGVSAHLSSVADTAPAPSASDTTVMPTGSSSRAATPAPSASVLPPTIVSANAATTIVSPRGKTPSASISASETKTKKTTSPVPSRTNDPFFERNAKVE